MQPDEELQPIFDTALKDTDVPREQDLQAHVQVWLCFQRSRSGHLYLMNSLTEIAGS